MCVCVCVCVILKEATWDTLQVGVGAHARFGDKALKINHCREPNTRMVIRKEKVDIVATRAISAGEALR